MLKIMPAPVWPEQLPAAFIESVKASTDIVPLIGRVIELKKSGNNFFGRCPFHSEKSPSFSVSPSKQIYHCFGCNANGDAIGFLMEHGALSFREAVTELAEEARIPLPSSDGSCPTPPDLSGMIKVNELVGAFFRHCLRHEEKAKDYVRTRKITPDAAKRFLIGYAPKEWQGLQEVFKDYESSQVLVNLGLVIAKTDDDKKEHRYDRFRGRLMFGIRDARGRIVGWGGRSIDGSEPKYINSPQSILFDKSSQLFGIFEAREAIRQTKQVVVTEGYIDTVANSMAGVAQTVATMGTACTEAHLERLVALAPEIIFSFDGDKAGLAAAWKSLNTCLPYASDDRSFKFLILPPGMDPDEVIQKKGVPAYLAMLKAANSLSGFMLSHLADVNDGLQTAENRAKFLRDGNEMIERLPPGNLRRIVKNALIKASALTTDEIRLMAASIPRAQPMRDIGGPWRTLTLAVSAQRKTAAAHADAMIEQLNPSLQDAFFASRFEAFPLQQQEFWRSLDECILAEDPQDEATDIGLAQRELLASAAAAIEKQLQREVIRTARADFRSGKTSEEAFLAGIQGTRVPAREQDTG